MAGEPDKSNICFYHYDGLPIILDIEEKNPYFFPLVFDHSKDLKPTSPGYQLLVLPKEKLIICRELAFNKTSNHHEYTGAYRLFNIAKDGSITPEKGEGSFLGRPEIQNILKKRRIKYDFLKSIPLPEDLIENFDKLTDDHVVKMTIKIPRYFPLFSSTRPLDLGKWQRPLPAETTAETREAAESRTALENLLFRYHQATARADAAEAQVATAREEATERMTAAQRELTAARAETTEATARAEALTAEIVTARAETAAATDRVTTAENQVVAAQQALADAEARHATTLETAQAETTAATEYAATAERARDEAIARAEAARTETTAATERATRAEEAARRITQRVTQAETLARTSAERLADAEQRVAEAENRVQKAERRIVSEKRAEAISARTTVQKEMEKQIRTAQAALAEAQQRAAKAEDTLRKQTAGQDAIYRERMMQARESHQKEIKALEQQIKELRETKAEIETVAPSDTRTVVEREADTPITEDKEKTTAVTPPTKEPASLKIALDQKNPATQKELSLKSLGDSPSVYPLAYIDGKPVQVITDPKHKVIIVRKLTDDGQYNSKAEDQFSIYQFSKDGTTLDIKDRRSTADKLELALKAASPAGYDFTKEEALRFSQDIPSPAAQREYLCKTLHIDPSELPAPPDSFFTTPVDGLPLTASMSVADSFSTEAKALITDLEKTQTTDGDSLDDLFKEHSYGQKALESEKTSAITTRGLYRRLPEIMYSGELSSDTVYIRQALTRLCATYPVMKVKLTDGKLSARARDAMIALRNGGDPKEFISTCLELPGDSVSRLLYQAAQNDIETLHTKTIEQLNTLSALFTEKGLSLINPRTGQPWDVDRDLNPEQLAQPFDELRQLSEWAGNYSSIMTPLLNQFNALNNEKKALFKKEIDLLAHFPSGVSSDVFRAITEALMAKMSNPPNAMSLFYAVHLFLSRARSLMPKSTETLFQELDEAWSQLKRLSSTPTSREVTAQFIKAQATYTKIAKQCMEKIRDDMSLEYIHKKIDKTQQDLETYQGRYAGKKTVTTGYRDDLPNYRRRLEKAKRDLALYYERLSFISMYHRILGEDTAEELSGSAEEIIALRKEIATLQAEITSSLGTSPLEIDPSAVHFEIVGADSSALNVSKEALIKGITPPWGIDDAEIIGSPTAGNKMNIKITIPGTDEEAMQNAAKPAAETMAKFCGTGLMTLRVPDEKTLLKYLDELAKQKISHERVICFVGGELVENPSQLIAEAKIPGPETVGTKRWFLHT